MTKKPKRKHIKTGFELNLEREVKQLQETLQFEREEHIDDQNCAARLRKWDNERIRERDSLTKILRGRIDNFMEVIELLGSELRGLKNNNQSLINQLEGKEVDDYKAVNIFQMEECNTMHPKVPAGETIKKRRK